MNTFSTVDQLWHYAARQTMLFGERVDSRNGGSRELIGASYALETTDYTFLTNATRGLSPSYAAAETLWYLSGSNTAEMLLAYAPSYMHYLTPEGIAHGAYGYRWAQFNQFRKVIDELKTEKNSRRAVMTCWRVDDDLGNASSRDLPCTLSLQFLLRGNKLHLVVTMRSNDLWLGMPYDIFAFTAIQRLMAEALDVDTGTYTHNVGSLHIYDKNEEKVQSVISDAPTSSANTVFRSGNGLARLESALGLEIMARQQRFEQCKPSSFVDLATAELRSNTTTLALVLMAASRWMYDWPERLTKQALREAFSDIVPPHLARLIVERMK